MKMHQFRTAANAAGVSCYRNSLWVTFNLSIISSPSSRAHARIWKLPLYEILYYIYSHTFSRNILLISCLANISISPHAFGIHISRWRRRRFSKFTVSLNCYQDFNVRSNTCIDVFRSYGTVQNASPVHSFYNSISTQHYCFDTPRSGMVYNFGRVCLSVCQTITFESPDVGSSYFHIRCTSREYR